MNAAHLRAALEAIEAPAITDDLLTSSMATLVWKVPGYLAGPCIRTSWGYDLDTGEVRLSLRLVPAGAEDGTRHPAQAAENLSRALVLLAAAYRWIEDREDYLRPTVVARFERERADLAARQAQAEANLAADPAMGSALAAEVLKDAAADAKASGRPVTVRARGRASSREHWTSISVLPVGIRVQYCFGGPGGRTVSRAAAEQRLAACAASDYTIGE